MPQTIPLSVNSLQIDLNNYRTVRQRSEKGALQAMLALSEDRFWALTDSLLEDGFLPTENILVLDYGDKKEVKEGNRRVAALKLILGFLFVDPSCIPPEISEKIKKVSSEWRVANQNIPCAVYNMSEKDKVERIVNLAHGKGEKAGRDQWKAIARARYNRDHGLAEPSLELLEKYIKHSTNITEEEKSLWTGDYPLSVLFDAMKRLAPRLDVASAPALAKKYPSINNKEILDEIVKGIGRKDITFTTLRNKSVDFAERYGLSLVGTSDKNGPSTTDNKNETATGSTATSTGDPASSAATNPAASSTGSTSPSTSTNNATDPGASGQPTKTTQPNSENSTGTNADDTSSSSSASAHPSGSDKPVAIAINDPRFIKDTLEKFVVRGSGRGKVVMLQKEALELNITKTPLAFCFILRSMFEISAKAYCDDHAANNGPKYTNEKNYDRKLVNILQDVCDHIIASSNQNPQVKKALQGAKTELEKDEGILSVTSLNQLIHNPAFSIIPKDISVTFGNIFPLLKMMNQ